MQEEQNLTIIKLLQAYFEQAAEESRDPTFHC